MLLDKIRLLDIDDLILLSLVGDGNSFKETAAKMNLAATAITQRMRKLEQIYGNDILEPRRKGTKKLTTKGMLLAEKAEKVLRTLI